MAGRVPLLPRRVAASAARGARGLCLGSVPPHPASGPYGRRPPSGPACLDGGVPCRAASSSSSSPAAAAGRPPVLDAVLSEDVGISPLEGTRVIRNATLEEKYLVEAEVLGTGMTGHVRLLTAHGSGQRYAVKSIATLGLSEKRWRMLHDEVEIYLKLDHPNICKLIEVYEDDRAVHLVMELCEGKMLADRLASRDRYGERDAATACLQMLKALHYLHWHGICHRDLKLENWVYTDDCDDAKLKLIDFGLSKVCGDLPMTAIEGTAAYMAPEVWEGNYDEKCDMWSLGVMLHMMLSGLRPFAGLQKNEIAMKVLTHGFSVSGPEWGSISELGRDFVSLLLEEEPEDRLSAKDALEHEWLTRLCSEDGPEQEISVDVLKRLQAFSSQNEMMRAACTLAAYSMTADDLSDLEIQFYTLDKDNKGTILLEDLTTALRNNLGMSDDDARQVFNRLDQTGDNEIHYSEFVAASLQSRLRAHSGMVRAAFRRFDVDSTGTISLANLREVLGDEHTGTRVEDIIATCDRNGNGVIEYDEFVHALGGLGGGGGLVPVDRPASVGVVRSLVRRLVDGRSGPERPAGLKKPRGSPWAAPF